jgi:hypothetical protein
MLTLVGCSNCKNTPQGNELQRPARAPAVSVKTSAVVDTMDTRPRLVMAIVDALNKEVWRCTGWKGLGWEPIESPGSVQVGCPDLPAGTIGPSTLNVTLGGPSDPDHAEWKLPFTVGQDVVGLQVLYEWDRLKSQPGQPAQATVGLTVIHEVPAGLALIQVGANPDNSPRLFLENKSTAVVSVGGSPWLSGGIQTAQGELLGWCSTDSEVRVPPGERALVFDHCRAVRRGGLDFHPGNYLASVYLGESLRNSPGVHHLQQLIGKFEIPAQP